MYMGKYLEKVFRLSQYDTNIKTEMIAGITTFVTMAYVLATVPNMLGNAGLNKSAVMTAVILLIVITTCAMAFYTNRPFALAPGLGSTGIGLFIALLGAKSCGLISASEKKNCLTFGDLRSPEVILCLIGFCLMLLVKIKNIPGGIILSILITTIAGIPLGVTRLPDRIISFPGKMDDIFLNIDIKGALNTAYIPFLIALFIPDFFSTFGTVLGVGAKAGYLDEKGNLPGIEKCFQVDAVSTSVGALFGIPGMTTYLESSAGVEAGGKTGLTVIFTGICFLLMLFFSPIVLMIPTAATAPVLIYIGIHMLGAMKNIDYSDMTEYMPAFLCIGFTIFANNIANGICIAIPVYVLMKLISGKVKEIQPVMYIVTAICILYFITLI